MTKSLTISANDLESNFSEILAIIVKGSRSSLNISSCEAFNSDSLIFLQNKTAITSILTSPPAIIVTTKALAYELKQNIAPETSIFECKNVGLAHALIKQYYADYDSTDAEWAEIHSSAVIHESVIIGKACRIGPNVVIGKNVSIGDHSNIRSGCVIEHDTVIGKNCVVHSLVNIGFSSEIGNRVIIRPSAVIANEGFGLSPDSDAKFHRVPHSGKVVIEDDVQIGSCCNIDRGTYGETRIKRGSKIDAQCHIAHNVQLGEDCIMTAQCVIAGSSKIGNHVIMSGKSGISDHVTICDDVTLLHRASVFTDITKKGKWAGTPAKPFKTYVQELNNQKQLNKLTDRIKQLEAEQAKTHKKTS